jgi:hypothetical protein
VTFEKIKCVAIKDNKNGLGLYGVRMVLAELVIRNVTATMVTAAIPAMTTIVHLIIFIMLLYFLVT